MSKRNLLSGREKELHDLAERYESAKGEGKSIYLDADEYADLSDWYATHNNLAEAFKAVEEGLELHPGETSLLVEKARLFIDRDETGEARRILEEVAEPYLPEVKLLKAELLLLEDRVEEAEALIDTVMEEEDDDEFANLVDAVYIFIECGYPEKAKPLLERAEEKYHKRESYIAAVADCAFALKDYGKAATGYEKLLDINPYSTSYWLGLGDCRFAEGDYNKAIDAADYALVAEEDNGPAYELKGDAYCELGNWEAALENFTLAYKYHAFTHACLYMYKALERMDRKDWATALSYFEEAIDHLGEDDTTSYAYLYASAGLCLYKMGETIKGIAYCQRGKKLDDDSAEPYIVEGCIFMEEGYEEDALKQWEIALKYPSPDYTWYRIGCCYLEKGDYKSARTALEEVIEINPRYARVKRFLAVVCLIQQDMENFHKYNKESADPISEAEAGEFGRLLREGGKEGEALLKALLGKFL
ncbi:MAG: tetratricopeptide repeat protein [Prevotellaceae bacterium]|nr:tetratricopeptide repeat protein [Prevotellaceae bacterium]